MDFTRRSALAVLASSALPRQAHAQGRLAFASGGAAIAVERFEAPGGGHRPAVMLLHGSDGPGPRYRAASRQLATAGYHVFLVHYLDRTGDTRASLPAIGRNLPAWTAVLRDGVAFVSGQPGVEAGRIGVLGISLGGGLALLAAQAEPRVGAVATAFGFLPGAFDPGGRLPPTLVLHDARDRVVPVEAAIRLKALLERRRIPHEVQIYPGEGHRLTAAAASDAGRRIAGFFRRHL